MMGARTGLSATATCSTHRSRSQRADRRGGDAVPLQRSASPISAPTTSYRSQPCRICISISLRPIHRKPSGSSQLGCAISTRSSCRQSGGARMWESQNLASTICSILASTAWSESRWCLSRFDMAACSTSVSNSAGVSSTSVPRCSVFLSGRCSSNSPSMPATRCCGTATGPGSGQLRKPRRESRMRLYRLRKPAETDRSATARIGELTAAPVNRLVSSTKRTKELLMVKTALYAAIGFAAISSIALAEDLSSAMAPLPPGTFTTSAHSDEWKIANALSAGPTTITEHATVVDWPANPKDGMSDGRVLRQGNNGWTCMPDVPGRPQHDPMCVDETMMKWLMATLAGKKPDIDRVGLSYMLMGEAEQGQGATPAKNPSQVKEWFYIGPMIMVVLPDSAKDALRGINQDLSNNQPYTTLLSSADVATPLWVIAVANGGDRIKEEPAK